jgi:SGT1 protein
MSENPNFDTLLDGVFDDFSKRLPEDTVSYNIYLVDAKSQSDTPSQTKVKLGTVQKAAEALINDLLDEYIWQRESFNLKLVTEDGSYS